LSAIFRQQRIFVADVDQRAGLDWRIAVRREEGGSFGAEVIDDRLERRLVAAGHRHELREGLRAPDRLALGVDVGQRPEQVLDDSLAVGIWGCRRHDLISVFRQQRGEAADITIVLETEAPDRTIVPAE